MPTEQRRPNLFLIGAQKSGTTTLAGMLDSHPEVFMCSPKEPGFLAFGEAGYRGLDGFGRLAQAASWVISSREAYLALFEKAPQAARWLGDASTWYLSEPGTAERLHEFNPDARILVILRHPAERAYSAWCHARRDGEEPCEDFAEALGMEQNRSNASHLLRYREMGRYASQLQRYFDHFGRQRVLVMLYEELRDEPERLWDRCCDFLGIDRSVGLPPTERKNRSGMPRSRVLHRLKRSEGLKRLLKKVLSRRLAARIGQTVDDVNLKRLPPVPERQKALLTREFEPETRALMDLTGRDLSHWLADDDRD